MEINIKDIKVGDIFSEESHYVVKSIGKNDLILNHLESGNDIKLTNSYVQKILKTSDQYTKEVKVNKEDSKDGSVLGIRSIWENIGTSEVFTVVFTKQDKELTTKQYKDALDKQQKEAIDLIDRAKKNKKSMAVAYSEALTYIQQNPISKIVEGEDRVLRGYKTQFISRDGKYDCIDIDLKVKGDGNPHRPVNINTIKCIVIGGIKYILK